MSHLTVPQILKLDWGDAELSTVRWEERGRDLALTFERTASNIELRCSWADGLKLDLENPSRGGRFLTWSGVIEPQLDGRYRVRFDFGSEGQLSLTCNDVMVVLSGATT
jgi:hypothetical protein